MDFFSKKMSWKKLALLWFYIGKITVFIIFFCILIPVTSSCQNEINMGYHSLVPHSHPPSIEGQWVDEGGVACSSFSDGVFETHSVDTNEKLAEGNYVLRSNNLLEIELQSLVRGTVSHIYCSPSVNSISLFCTTMPEGSRFVLTRQK